MTILPRLQGLPQSFAPVSGAGSPEIHQVRDEGRSCSQNRLPRKKCAEHEVGLLPKPVLAPPTSNTATHPAFRFLPYKWESRVGGRVCGQGTVDFLRTTWSPGNT